MSKTFSVHPKYIQEAKLAWNRKSEERKEDLTKELGQSISKVSLFLKGQPVNKLNFIAICQILGLDWRKIAGLDVQESRVDSGAGEVNPSDAIANPRPAGGVRDVDEALNDLLGTLCEMLRRLTSRVRDLLNADRASIFLLDQQKEALVSIIAEDGTGSSLMIEIPWDRGIASLAASSLEVINIPFDVYDDPRSEEAKNTDKNTGYRTYTILAWPLLNEQKILVGVVQLVNKLKPNYNPEDSLYKRIDDNGFTQEDEVMLVKFAPAILRIIERCQFCYQLAKNLREKKAVVRDGVVLQKDELIAELKQKTQQMQKLLNRM